MLDTKYCWLKESCNKIDCDSFCKKLYRLDTIYNTGFISINQRKHIKLFLDDDKADAAAFNTLKNIQDNIESFVKTGNNLYIYSTITGNGKSSWCLRLAQMYVNKMWARTSKNSLVMFINVPKYLLALKENITTKSEYISKIKENIYDTDLVIWDDIGSKVATPFEHENLLSIIDTRITNNKSNIYTSNLLPNELHEFMGDRLFSRIYGTAEVIQFVGKDKRGII